MSLLFDGLAAGSTALGFGEFGATLSSYGASVDSFFDDNEWVGKGFTSAAAGLSSKGGGRSQPASTPRDIINASQARQATQDPLTAGKGKGIRSEDPEAIWSKWQSRMSSYARNK